METETKFTPGPWVIESDLEPFRDADELSIVNREHDGDGWDICTVHSSVENARLIASAPAILAALRAMVGMTINSGHVSDDMAPALNMALAVIKEATGETE